MRLDIWGALAFRIAIALLLVGTLLSPSSRAHAQTVCNETDDPGGVPDNTDDPDCTPVPAKSIPPGAMLGAGGPANPSGYTSEPVNTATGNYFSGSSWK